VDSLQYNQRLSHLCNHRISRQDSPQRNLL
jgi:hypothetical protein